MGTCHVISLKHWPSLEQPRQRLKNHGPQVLTEAELLAVVLGCSSRGTGGVIQTCRDLLRRFGGLEALTRCGPHELMQVSGIGPARACALTAVVELARRISTRPIDPRAAIRCSKDAYRWIKPRLALLDHECFLTLTLDARHTIRGVHQVARGSPTAVEIHPREVFTPCVRDAAAAVIVAHNHPSGDPRPSSEDRRLTDRLVRAGELMGIPLLDHLVVGQGTFISFADQGLL